MRTLHPIPDLGAIHRLNHLTLDWEKQRNDQPPYNIEPAEGVLSVTVGGSGNHRLREGCWWFVPWWRRSPEGLPC